MPFADYIRFFDFRSGVQGEAMLGSLMISVLSVITSGIIGVFLAVILQRWDFLFDVSARFWCSSRSRFLH